MTGTFMSLLANVSTLNISGIGDVGDTLLRNHAHFVERRGLWTTNATMYDTDTPVWRQAMASSIRNGYCLRSRPPPPNSRYPAGFAPFSTSAIRSSGWMATDVTMREGATSRYTGLVFGHSGMHIIYAAVADRNVDGTACVQSAFDRNDCADFTR